MVNDLGRVLSVVEKEDLGASLQRDFEMLALRGLYAVSGGGARAMIARKHRDRPGRTTPYRAGDEFEFRQDANDEATWRLEHVDLEKRRVALSREGATVWLAMRDRSVDMGRALAGRSSRTFVEGRSVPVVAQVSREQLRAQLLESGLSASDLDEMFALADAIDAPEEPKPADFAAGPAHRGSAGSRHRERLRSEAGVRVGSGEHTGGDRGAAQDHVFGRGALGGDARIAQDAGPEPEPSDEPRDENETGG